MKTNSDPQSILIAANESPHVHLSFTLRADLHYYDNFTDDTAEVIAVISRTRSSHPGKVLILFARPDTHSSLLHDKMLLRLYEGTLEKREEEERRQEKAD